MGQQHQDVRRAAAEAFIESLEQLEQTFECANGQPTQPPPQARNSGQPKAPANEPARFDLNSFEEAIADIEQFIQRQKDER